MGGRFEGRWILTTKHYRLSDEEMAAFRAGKARGESTFLDASSQDLAALIAWAVEADRSKEAIVDHLRAIVDEYKKSAGATDKLCREELAIYARIRCENEPPNGSLLVTPRIATAFVLSAFAWGYIVSAIVGC